MKIAGRGCGIVIGLAFLLSLESDGLSDVEMSAAFWENGRRAALFGGLAGGPKTSSLEDWCSWTTSGCSATEGEGVGGGGGRSTGSALMVISCKSFAGSEELDKGLGPAFLPCHKDITRDLEDLLEDLLEDRERERGWATLLDFSSMAEDWAWTLKEARGESERWGADHGFLTGVSGGVLKIKSGSLEYCTPHFTFGEFGWEKWDVSED